MIRPTGKTLALAAALLPLAAWPTFADATGAWWGWCGAWLLLAAALLVEFACLPTRNSFVATVQAPAALALGDREDVVVELAAGRHARLAVLLEREGPGEPWPTATVTVQPGTRASVRLSLTADRRGIVTLTLLHLGWSGPLGLLCTSASTALGRPVAVVPNLPMVRRKALQLLERRESHTGARIERHLGDGSEFEALRDFVVGMDRRAVDWKASARLGKLLCREFRAERDHNVVLCLDTGRLMGEPLQGLPRLDHAIHAALQLGYVCLRTGDRVGLHAFAEGPQQFVAPQAGMPALQAVQTRMAALAYGSHETNFTLGLTDLLQRLPRRSLVVLFTEFVDSITAELMLRNLRWLARRHVLLFVALRDPLVPQLAQRRPTELAGVHRSLVAGELLREREVVLERLRSIGVQVVDCGVDELAVDLIDRYLAVKRRELV